MRKLLLPGVMLLALLGACRSAPQSIQDRMRLMPPSDEVITRNDWYQPWQRVAGVERALPRAAVGNGTGVDLARFLAVARSFDSYATVVLQDGRLVAEDYAAPYTADSRFNTQSMHRGLLVLALDAALADGHIASLDARVDEFLPQWRGDPRGAITLAQLLYGRSGLAGPRFAQSADSPGLQMFVGTDLAATVAGIPSAAAPGSIYKPNEVEAQVLGLALERAVKEPYARFVSRRLWQPVGAADAFVQLDRPGGNTRAFCCLLARARDWARIGELVRNGGRVGTLKVIPAALIEQLHQPIPGAPGVGPFWFLQATPLGPRAPGEAPPPVTPFSRPDVFFAGGRGGQRVYVIPSLRAVVVRIGRIRNDFDDGAFLNPLIDALAR